MNNRAIGNQAEDRACVFLRQNKYKILKRNWYLGFGEIDILAQNRHKEICIIEVKYVAGAQSLARAKEQVHYFKQKTLQKLYLATAKCYPENMVRAHILAMDDVNIELTEDAIIRE